MPGHPRTITCWPISTAASARRKRAERRSSPSRGSSGRRARSRNSAGPDPATTPAPAVNSEYGWCPSRRGFLRLLAGWAAMPLPAHSGVRLAAQESRDSVVFTDVTAAAGLLRAKNVSGSPDNKQFLLEEMGCGAAFFDYDHDG